MIIESLQPQNLKASVVGTQITLTWTASRCGSIANYNLRRDGVIIATPAAASSSYVDTGMLDRHYRYLLTVIDTHGRESPGASVVVQVEPGANLTMQVTYQEQPGDGGYPDIQWAWH